MTYQPPTSLMEVLQKIQFEEALQADDARYIDTRIARGSQQTYTRLAKKFGLNPNTNAFFPPTSTHLLFFGHVGSGKTTELRQYARDLNVSGYFHVIEVDVLAKLDHNNLQYSEALLAMAETLSESLINERMTVSSHALQLINNWFSTAVSSKETNHAFSAEIKSDIEAGFTLPGIFKVLSKITASAKTGSTYKNEWRQEIRNRFTSLAEAFNSFIESAEKSLNKRIIFLLDGTDKMRGEDTKQFFIQDAEQLLAINTFVIYTAPLHLKYSGQLVGKLQDLVLPMIKLYEKNGQHCEAGKIALRKILLQRIDKKLFANESDIKLLVDYCGGHPRELLRLLGLCCEVAPDEIIDSGVILSAVNQLASDYRRFLKPDDYELLAQLDVNPLHGGNTEQIQNLLYCLALLEYNDGSWRRSHPVVKTLDGYIAAQVQIIANTNDSQQ